MKNIFRQKLLYLCITYCLFNSIAYALNTADYRVNPIAIPPFQGCWVAAGPKINWSGCNKTREKLGGVNFMGSYFAYTDFTASELIGDDFKNVSLFSADLTSANLSRSSFLQSDLNWANLSNANLNSVNFNGVDLQHTTFEGNDFTYTRLNNANLMNVNLTKAKFIETELIEANLHNTVLNEASFLHTNLENANLSMAKLNKTTFNGSNLTGANLNEADLTQTIFLNSNLAGVDLFSANLTNANLSNANLSNANLTNADLTNTNLTNADLSNASVNGANLDGVILIDANLKGAKWVSGQVCDGGNRGFCSSTNSKVIFTTSEGHNGNFKGYMGAQDGYQGADLFCKNSVDNPMGKGHGDWMALLADRHVTKVTTYYRLDVKNHTWDILVPIVKNNRDSDYYFTHRTLINSIQKYNGGSSVMAWTGGSDGLADCEKWTSPGNGSWLSPTGWVGDVYSTGDSFWRSSWWSSIQHDCGKWHSLYCVQQ